LPRFFYPLPGSIARPAYLRLCDALFAVGAVPEFHELLAGLGSQNGLHRFFDGLATPLRSDLRLAHQAFVRQHGADQAECVTERQALATP
jgi:hypothetical protein